MRGAARDRRRADPRREGHREVDGRARSCDRAVRVDGDARLVELPIGATEDRVVGSLDLQKVLRDGEHAFSPGLLARAHGGVLYVDEVNLLHDHLVDVLLDAAAMGRVHVERDGVSHSHEARFVLIGTMNPEEGELRPQLLDRFGLTVDVSRLARRRRAGRGDPQADGVRGRPRGVRRALRRRRRGAGPPDRGRPRGRRRRGVAGWGVAAHRGAVRGVRRGRHARRPGGRADRGGPRGVARARMTVAEEDIRVAAELALPHRRRRDPFDDPGLDPEQLDEALAQAGDPPPEPEHDPEPDPPGGGGAVRVRRRIRLRPSGGPSLGWFAAERTGAAAAFRTKALVVPGVGEGAPGRRSRARNRTGTTVSATDDPDAGHGVHLFGTLLAAARRQQRLRPGLGGARRRAARDSRRAAKAIW